MDALFVCCLDVRVKKNIVENKVSKKSSISSFTQYYLLSFTLALPLLHCRVAINELNVFACTLVYRRFPPFFCFLSLVFLTFPYRDAYFPKLSMSSRANHIKRICGVVCLRFLCLLVCFSTLLVIHLISFVISLLLLLHCNIAEYCNNLFDFFNSFFCIFTTGIRRFCVEINIDHN